MTMEQARIPTSIAALALILAGCGHGAAQKGRFCAPRGPRVVTLAKHHLQLALPALARPSAKPAGDAKTSFIWSGKLSSCAVEIALLIERNYPFVEVEDVTELLRSSLRGPPVGWT